MLKPDVLEDKPSEAEIVQEPVPEDTPQLSQVPEELKEKHSIQIIQQNLQKFFDKTEFLSKKQLRKLLRNLTIQPLNKEPIKLSSQEERDAFDLGVEVSSAKLILLSIALDQQRQINLKMELLSAFYEAAKVVSQSVSEKTEIPQETLDSLNKCIEMVNKLIGDVKDGK